MERVLVLQAGKEIAADEQITIDFGSDYFAGRKRSCCFRRCRYTNDVLPVGVGGL